MRKETTTVLVVLRTCPGAPLVSAYICTCSYIAIHNLIRISALHRIEEPRMVILLFPLEYSISR